MSASSLLIFSLLAIALNSASSFVQPRAFAIGQHNAIATTTSQYSQLSSSSSLQLVPDHLFTASSIILSADAEAVANANSSLQGVRTFFIVIVAVVIGFAGLTYVTAAYIVPKAAERLEYDTKRLRPGLWEEYEAKLLESETMATRPDLLQELGDLMRPVIIENFEVTANDKDAGKRGTSEKTSILGDKDQWKD